MGCKLCSRIEDYYDPSIIHLNARDVAMVTDSRTPLDKLLAFKQRMNWKFKGISSLDSNFNWDYFVSFTPEQMEKGEMHYN